jgi:hypothetical protein
MKARAILAPIFTGVVCLVTGLTIGLLFNQQPSQKSASIESTGAAAHDVQQLGVVVPVTNASGITAAEIRQIVRDELASNASSAKSTDGVIANRHVDQQTPGSGEKTTTPATISQVASASKMRSMVDAAIARRQWTESDVTQLRGELDSLTAEQRSELIQKIVVAINRGEMIPQTEQLF